MNDIDIDPSSATAGDPHTEPARGNGHSGSAKHGSTRWTSERKPRSREMKREEQAATPSLSPLAQKSRLRRRRLLKPLHETTGLPQKAPGNDLRRHYRLKIEIGLIFALLVVIGLFHAPIHPGDRAVDLTMDEQETVQMEDVKQTEQLTPPPAPPRPPAPVAVADDAILDDVELNLDASLDLNEPISNVPPPPPPPLEEEEEQANEDEEIFVAVEDMPELIGGIRTLYEYLEYPEMAQRAGVEGTVVVQFIIEADGTPSNPQVIRSASSLLDKEAVAAIMKLRFKPGRQRGRDVRVRYAIPVRFELQSAQDG